MKHLVLLLLLLTALQVRVGSAQTPIDTLKELDKTFNNPFTTDLVSDAAYSRLIYRNIVAIGGLNVKQGKALGTSLTVDDKGGALNIGLGPFKRKDAEYIPRLALQATVKATADNGFITLFSGSEYQKTLGFGGGFLYFFTNGMVTTYRERTKKDLQWQYWKLREKEKDAWGDSYQPKIRPTWQDSSRKAICNFMTLWYKLQKKSWATSYYGGEFLKDKTLTWANDPQEQAFMRSYLKAEHDVLLFLPKGWDTAATYRDGKGEGVWLKANFPDATACITDDYSTTDVLISATWDQKVAKSMQRTSMKRIDLLQDSAHWETKYFSWLSASGLYSTVQQGILNTNAGLAGFADKVRDNFWTGQASYNGLWVGKKDNVYWTVGLAIEKRRNFDATTLQTYETGKWQKIGTDSVRVVNQKQLYPSDPGQKLALSVLPGITYYHHGTIKWGISANYTQKCFNSHQSLATLGLFTPIEAGKTSILLMPLVRWDNQGEPHRWTVGVSLTTTIPGFVTAK